MIGPHDLVRFTYKIGSDSTRRIVVQKDDDTLTPEETRQHWREIDQAMLDELMAWAKLKCFSCKARQDATNVIDTRWVLKWKHKQEAVDATKASEGQAGNTTRVIRARLTVRGFKDQDKGVTASYAGTSSRYAQKLLISEAVRQGCDIATTEKPKAFLQGVTYGELAELTKGQDRKTVCAVLAAEMESVNGSGG